MALARTGAWKLQTCSRELGVSVTVADARFCKPLDTDLIRQLAKNHEALITVEEGSIGGFASHVLQFLALDGLSRRKPQGATADAS